MYVCMFDVYAMCLSSDCNSQKSNDARDPGDSYSLSAAQIEQLKSIEAGYAREDAAIAKRLVARNELESLCLEIQQVLSDARSFPGRRRLEARDQAAIEARVAETLAWLATNPYAVTSRSDYVAKHDALASFWSHLQP